MGIIVVAFGGNALQSPDQHVEHSDAGVAAAAAAIVDIIQAGHQVVITHGNGPQVGYGLLRNVWAPEGVPRLSLASLVAQSQGELGTLLALSVGNALKRNHLSMPVVSLITHVEVDPADPEFQRATKPVGPVLETTEQVAAVRSKTGLDVMEERGGFRMVVPSPTPMAVVEAGAITALLSAGALVIAGGGGGIPVVRDESRGWRETRGVIDKDRTSALLARELGADTLVFLTDVDGVYQNFGMPNMMLIREGSWRDFDLMTCTPQATGVGSMQPKVAAACAFVRTTHRPAAIGKLQDAGRVVAGQAGTHILWQAEEERKHAN